MSNVNVIPAEMRSRKQWLTWNLVDGRKIPNGKSNDPNTWTSFEKIANQERIAFVFSSDDELCGIDLDDCIVDGTWTSWCEPIFQRFRGVAYCEVSPSGTGVKFTTRAKKPEGSRCTNSQGVECYDHARFWTVTGNVVEGFETVGDGQAAVDWLCATYLAKQTAKPSSSSTTLLQRAQAYADKMSPASQGDLRNAAFRNAGSLHAIVGEFSERLSDNEVYLILRSWNARNATPLRDDELLEASVNGRKNGTPPADKPPKERLPTYDHSTATEKLSKPLSTPAADILTSYIQNLLNGTVAQLTKLRSVLDGLEIGSGLLSVLGAPPGFGKTCLSMQIVFEALECDPNLTATIANAETTFEGLLRRELTRITGINSRKIRFGNLDESEREKIEIAATELNPLVERINVIEDCSFNSLIALASEPPGLVVVDYLQKFAPPGDARQGVNAVMAQCRILAKKSWRVLALSATARTNGRGGSGHDSTQLNQASFRESGDIEFNADSCYLLVDQGPVNGQAFERSTLLKCVKNRHDSKEDRELVFNMRRQRFESSINIDSLACHGDFPNPFGGDDDEA